MHRVYYDMYIDQLNIIRIVHRLYYDMYTDQLNTTRSYIVSTMTCILTNLILPDRASCLL